MGGDQDHPGHGRPVQHRIGSHNPDGILSLQITAQMEADGDANLIYIVGVVVGLVHDAESALHTNSKD